MRPRQVWAIAKKELRQASRDPLSLAMLLGLPTLMLVMYGFAINFDVRSLRAAVVDDAGTSLSRAYAAALEASGVVEFAAPSAGVPQLQQRMQAGDISVGIHIPPDFERRVLDRTRPAAQLLVDTSNAAQGLSAASYAVRIVGEFGSEAGLASFGLSGARANVPLVTSAHRVWFNPNQDETWFQSISHLLRMITVFAVLLPAVALVREKERGTVEQLLVSPLTPVQIMLSKVLAMTAVILFCTAMALYGVMLPLFHVPIKGEAWLFFLLTALYTFTTAGLGLVAATVMRNQAQVGMVLLLFVAPILLLSGITTPFESIRMLGLSRTLLVRASGATRSASPVPAGVLRRR